MSNNNVKNFNNYAILAYEGIDVPVAIEGEEYDKIIEKFPALMNAPDNVTVEGIELVLNGVTKKYEFSQTATPSEYKVNKLKFSLID